MISSEKFETSEGRIVIHAEEAEVVWTVKGDIWCLEAPDVET
jgi:hypothetical protein